MSSPEKQQKTVRLRPTLVIGLGGSGYQVAVQLKARLVEAFGSEAGYDDAVKFLVLDTANENFTARQPNHPERDPVGLSAGREFVRISDVPLQELMENRNKMMGERALSGVYRHLPKTLRSSHIDQGAQQIRRLGRIALFHRYQDVKVKLSGVIHDLLKMRDTRSAGDVALKIDQRQRLRVYIACSICGGTGSGTFIDIAYITRYLAEIQNLPPQNIDVVGLLMLPEAFPNIETTGADRIRANACAALLDLEYYNQDTINEDVLYHEDFGIEWVRGRSRPFNVCYLVGGSNSESRTLDGVKDIAPMLADSIFMMISSRVGEQLDATLDNIKIVTTQYHEDGHRRLYSGLGISQVSYPREWLQQRFMKAFQQWVIQRYVLPDVSNMARARTTAESWFMRERMAVSNEFSRSLDDVVEPLEQLQRTIDNMDDPARRLRDAFRRTETNFHRDYSDWLETQRTQKLAYLRRTLSATVQEEINRALRQNATTDMSEVEGGLRWTGMWLDRLEESINHWIEQVSGDDRRAIDFDRRINEAEEHVRRQSNVIGVLELRSQRQAVKQSIDALRNYFQTAARELAAQQTQLRLFSDFLTHLKDLRQQVSSAIRFWDERLSATHEISERPIVTAATLNIMNERELLTFLEDKLNSAKADNIHERLDEAFKWAIPTQGTHPSLALSLDERYHELLAEAVQDLSRRLYATKASETITQILRRMSVTERKELFNELQVKGATLLRYEEGALSASPPPQFRVVGLRSREEDSELLSTDISGGDVSYVSTDNAAQISYLHTQHGIPLSALQNYDIYYEQYRRLAQQPDMILHISNELERAPYNPASIYFMNKNQLRLLFIRAVAYGWLGYVPDGRTFAYSLAFRDVLLEALQQHITNLLNQFSQDSINEQSARLNRLEVDYMTALRHHLQQEYKVYPMLYLLPRNWEGAFNRLRDDRADVIIKTDNAPLQYASTLQLAVSSLVNSPLQTFTKVFETAFHNHYTEIFQRGTTDENDVLWQFLSQFGAEYIDGNVSFDSQQFYYISGNPADRELQQRMLLQLAAYELMETRTRRQATNAAYFWR